MGERDGREEMGGIGGDGRRRELGREREKRKTI